MLLVTLMSVVTAALCVVSAVEEISPKFDAFRDTRFLVFTRFNPTIGQVVSVSDMATVRASNWDANRPTRMIIHGQLSDAQSELNIVLTAAFLSSADVNVVVLDWGEGANTINYVAARNQVANVGSVGAAFLDNLQAANLLDFGRMTIASHSLGVHVAGFVGKRVTRGRVNTIFG